MRSFTFKVFEESDPDLISWLNSLPRRERSTEIRRALRAYVRKPDFVIRKRRYPMGESNLGGVKNG